MAARRGPAGGAPAELVEAVVVGHVDLGERDRIVRLLCAPHGRVDAVARGARGSRRRFAGALDTGHKVEVALRPGRSELWHVDEARLLDGREGLRRDLLRLSLAAYACELCGALARPHHPEPRLYGLLDMALLLLDAMQGPPGAAFRLALEAKALTFAGLAPALTRCPTCGQAPAAPMRFDAVAGGAAHAACRPGGVDVDPAWLLAVDAARRTPLRELVDAPLPPGPAWALAEMVEANQGRPLRARGVLAALQAALQGTPPHDREPG